MSAGSLSHTSAIRVEGNVITPVKEILAAEEPLEIRIIYGEPGERIQKSISVTMRTPGNDDELAAGFLFTEGLISSRQDISEIYHEPGKNSNTINIALRAGLAPDIKKTERNFYTTSSCGVCGKASIEAVRTNCVFKPKADFPKIQPEIIWQLPGKLRGEQSVFDQTGGIHACALFSITGELLLLREDVGRHNALDKLIGASLIHNKLPLDNHILLLSGRASFELIQKAAMAGICFIAAVGAPSSLAVEMAEEWELTLVGFLRGNKFNIYCGSERISL